MTILVILTVMAALFAMIVTSFSMGVSACNKYHRDLRAARSAAVRDYREKERALFQLSREETDFYRRAIVDASPEIPLTLREEESARVCKLDNSISFTGRKSQFHA